MRLRQGSLAWFVAHDLRQSWRGLGALFGGASPRRIVLILIVAAAALHLAAWPVAQWFGMIEADGADVSALRGYFAYGLAFVLPWIVAQSMTATTRSLFARGDLELILASPASTRTALAARLFAIMLDSVGSVAMLLLPLADANALGGRWHWLALYPALLACGLFGAAVGLILALGLLVAVGPRRARIASQIVATIVGGGFVLSVQIFNLLPEAMRVGIQSASRFSGPGAASLVRSAVALPVRAAMGDVDAMLAWSLIGVVAFAATAIVYGRLYARAAVLSAGAPGASGRIGRKQNFRAGLGAAFRAKERQLIWRDPWLLSQIALQVIYTLPVSIILLRNGGVTASAGVAFAPTIVVVGAQLSGALSWIALSGEDAPEFLATAPVTRAQRDARKIEAIVAPIALLLAAPVAALAWSAPWSGFCAAVFAAAAIVSAALINLWRQAPGRRAQVLRRHAQSKLVGLIEHLSSILWAVGAGIATLGSWTFIVPVALAGAVLWFARPRAVGASSRAAASRTPRRPWRRAAGAGAPP